MRGRGNIYWCYDKYVYDSVGVPVEFNNLYTGYNTPSKIGIKKYYATAYCGNGQTSVVSSTKMRVIAPTLIIKQDIDASNITNETVCDLEDNKTVLLNYKNFVPTSYGSEVSLCKVIDENSDVVYDIVLNPGTGFYVKHTTGNLTLQ